MKRALIVGINYTGTDCQLSGCVNDALNVQKLLMTHFNYNKDHIHILTDDHDCSLKPTKENIMLTLSHLVELTKPGDTLFMSFSCHGGQIDDVDDDEKNNFDTRGQDDVICPLDFQTHGYIVDDDLKKEVINKLPKGAKLRAVFDCCHSSTLLDLPFVYNKNKFIKVEEVNDYCDDCLSISGCKDSECSNDVSINNTNTGALTYCLLNLFKASKTTPMDWFMLLKQAEKFMKDKHYKQTPTICVGDQKLLHQHVDL